ncbi:MAG: YnbE family lipoprotein [Sphingomonas bacterium]|jgi:hypothetical protein|nr:YnbE family lipoprotein [Sphingomonas bacterium]
MSATTLTMETGGARFRIATAGAMAVVSTVLGGCIQVTAPEKPIEINLNVTIRQEVVVSLRDDVKNLDKQFPGVF